MQFKFVVLGYLSNLQKDVSSEVYQFLKVLIMEAIFCRQVKTQVESEVGADDVVDVVGEAPERRKL